MPININGAWKDVTRSVINISGIWKSISRGVINIAGVWKELLFGAPAISQQVEIEQTQAMDYVITLIGYNYYWTNYDSATYKFEKSVNNGSTWTEIDSGPISNPSSGTYNTKQYIIPSLTPNVANIYRFVVTASSSGGSENTSTSNTTTVQATRNISDLQSTSTTPSTISLSWTKSQYSNSQLLQYRETGSSTWIDFNTYSGTAQSATVTGLNYDTQYSFRIRPFTGTSQQGYPGNYSNTATEFTADRQLVCYPKLTCDDTYIYTSTTQPSIGSSAGSACWVSSAITQYQYYTNRTAYACDTPTSVAGLYSPCPGCSTYSVLVTTTNCNGTIISTNAQGTGCSGCNVSSSTSYLCASTTSTSVICGSTTYIAYNNVCPTQGSLVGDACNCQSATALSCSSPRNTTTCPTSQPSTLGGRCSSCTPIVSYSCPSGYGSPYLSGGRYYCTGTTTPFATIFATSSTRYSYSVNENINVKEYNVRVSSTTTSCNGTPYTVANAFSSCPGCSVYSETSYTCSPGSSSYTDYRCDSRAYYVCDNGPFYTDENPVTYSCSQTTISTYNYKKYIQSCNNSITYYASSENDPICDGCPTSEVP